MRHALVTGGAGFIGSNLIDRLLAEGWEVTNVDNFDSFYDRVIKERNIEKHYDYDNYHMVEADIRDYDTLKEKLTGDYDVIVHLAAKAGVRPSIKDPITYQEVNVRGTQNLLELTKYWKVSQFIFGSSSSVYGINPNAPWKEDECVLMPISPYASTKVSGELLGHVYSHLYGICFIALRFFTVYGPRQRPDLAIHKFIKLALEDKPIPIYGDGNTMRDYTYIDDIVEGILKTIQWANCKKKYYEIFNIGSSNAVTLSNVIQIIEELLGKKVIINRLLTQPGDVNITFADITKAKKVLGYFPSKDLREGIKEFIQWFKFKGEEFHG